MAVLAADELTELRQALANGEATVGWNKAEINAAAQAVEDWYESERATVGALMETAAPGKFTNPQKKAIGAYWMRQKFGREGV